MKKVILLLIFLFSVSFAIEEQSVKNLEKPKKESYRHKDRDDDGIWDAFIKSILKKSEKKEKKQKKDIKVKKKKSTSSTRKGTRTKKR